MGRRRHANSSMTAFIDSRVKCSDATRHYISLGRAEVLRLLDAADKVGTADPSLIEASVWLDFMKKRIRRASGPWWLNQEHNIRDWIGRWGRIAKTLKTVRPEYARKFSIVVGCRAVRAVRPAGDVMKTFLRVEAFKEAVREYTPGRRHVLVARGSNSAVIENFKSLADDAEVRPVFLKHSVQSRMLCESRKLAEVVGRRAPSCLVFANAGRLGRASWRGEALTLSALGVPVHFGSNVGARNHCAGGDATRLRRSGRPLDGWYVAPADARVGTAAAGVRIVDPDTARRVGLRAACELRAGDDVTALHLVVLASTLMPKVVTRIRDAGDAEAEVVVGGRAAPISLRQIARVVGADVRAVERAIQIEAAGRDARLSARGRAFVEAFDRDVGANLSSNRGAAQAPLARGSRHGSHPVDQEVGIFHAAF